jgi:pimeloyl-ACP methyl ester carboxylesterase
MPTATVNGVRLFYQLTGEAGPPLVLVHGSWSNHRGWTPVLAALADRFRVLAYDRRGHSQSERPPGQGSIDEDAADLAALIEHLDLAPAHLAASSFGGSVALRLAARRPDLFRSLTAHEPPLFGLLADRPDLQPALQEANTGTEAVRSLLESGDSEAGARLFMETFAVGPGGWDHLPPEVRATLVGNAPTFLDELRDPDAFTVNLAALAAFPHPALLTYGDQSPPFYPPIVAKLATVLPRAELRAYPGAGHVPHTSHPAEYVITATSFIDAAENQR